MMWPVFHKRDLVKKLYCKFYTLIKPHYILHSQLRVLQEVLLLSREWVQIDQSDKEALKPPHPSTQYQGRHKTQATAGFGQIGRAAAAQADESQHLNKRSIPAVVDDKFFFDQAKPGPNSGLNKALAEI